MHGDNFNCFSTELKILKLKKKKTIGLTLVIFSMVNHLSILVFLEYILSGFCFSCNALLNLIYPYFINA